MRAVVTRDKRLTCEEIEDPVPIQGQTLVRTLCCGICGSDLHALHFMDNMVEGMRRAGGGDGIDPAKDMVFGHEFGAEVLDHGPGTDGRFKPGTRVVSVPMTFGPAGIELVSQQLCELSLPPPSAPQEQSTFWEEVLKSMARKSGRS